MHPVLTVNITQQRAGLAQDNEMAVREVAVG
jgi:hypothetical protein